MFCGKCGTQVDDAVVFCPSCGTPVSRDPSGVSGTFPAIPAVSSATTPKAPFEIPSLVCSIAGLVVFFFWAVLTDEDDFVPVDLLFPAIPALSVTGLVLGCAGLKKQKRGPKPQPASPKLMSGMIMGIVGTALWTTVLTAGMFVAVLAEM